MNLIHKIIHTAKFGFFENVCSSRTNLGLLQNLRKLQQCNRGIDFND